MTATPRPRAILTIDDAPSPQIGEVLDVLTKCGIKAIFFCSGEQIAPYREFLLQALRQGHWLGNHGWNHRAFSSLSLADCVTQIEATEAVLSDLRTEAGCTNHPRLFRFPYGDKGFGIGPGRVLLSRLHPKVRALQKYLRVHQFRSTLDLGIQIPRPRFPYTLTTLDQDWLWGSDSRDWFFSKSGQSPGAYTHWMSENFPAVPPSDEFRVFLFHDHPGHPAYLQSVLPLLAARFSFVLPKESP